MEINLIISGKADELDVPVSVILHLLSPSLTRSHLARHCAQCSCSTHHFPIRSRMCAYASVKPFYACNTSRAVCVRVLDSVKALSHSHRHAHKQTHWLLSFLIYFLSASLIYCSTIFLSLHSVSSSLLPISIFVCTGVQHDRTCIHPSRCSCSTMFRTRARIIFICHHRRRRRQSHHHQHPRRISRFLRWKRKKRKKTAISSVYVVAAVVVIVFNDGCWMSHTMRFKQRTYRYC